MMNSHDCCNYWNGRFLTNSNYHRATMQKHTTISKILLSVGLCCLLDSALQAATTFSVNYSGANTITSEPDSHYNTGKNAGAWDQISTVFHAPVETSDATAYVLSSSMFARHYDSDPSRPGDTGLLDRATLTGFNDPPWLVKHGLPPRTIGSSTSGTNVNGLDYDAAASYLAFTVNLNGNEPGEKVIFDGLTLQIGDFYNADTVPELWAGISSDQFQSPVVPTIIQLPGAERESYIFDFSGINALSSTVEIRLYGVIGLDQGTFGSAVIQGNISPLPVPEPGSIMLMGSLALAVSLRRRRG